MKFNKKTAMTVGVILAVIAAERFANSKGYGLDRLISMIPSGAPAAPLQAVA